MKLPAHVTYCLESNFMTFDLKSHVKTLSAIAAPSGHEAPAREAIRAAWTPYVDSFEVDGLGSLIALKRGSPAAGSPRRRVMLAAHMDEIALMVAEVREGFIRTLPLGGIDYRPLLTQPVLVHGQRPLKGVFAAASTHVALPRDKYLDAEDMWIDVGLPAAEVATLVRVGDLITFDVTPFELKGDRVAGKSLDNRASVAAVTFCLDQLARRTHEWDVVAVATVQEEVGLHGAMTAAHHVAPDLAIAIDATFGSQRGTDDDEAFDLGDGPTIGVGPNFHPRLVKALRGVAEELELDVQIEGLHADSGTDAWAIQVSREGVPTGLISIPIRNMHTPLEVVDLRDVTLAGRLLAEFIARLDAGFLDSIAWSGLNNSPDTAKGSPA